MAADYTFEPLRKHAHVKQERYFLKNREGKMALKNGALASFAAGSVSPPLQRGGGAVKGILDQSQRRIKTSAPRFTSIFPHLTGTLCLCCLRGIRNGSFVTLHTASTRSISLLHPPSDCHSNVSFLSRPPTGHKSSPHSAFLSGFSPTNARWHLHKYSTEEQNEH